MILALTGPTGSGKSTISEAIARKLDKCVTIDADHIKHMIVSGFYRDNTNAGGWSFSEWALVGESIGLLAKNFCNKGFDVVINGYIDEPGWSALEELIKLDNKILLLSDIETNTSRDAGRDRALRMGDESVAQHQSYFRSSIYYEDFTVLDTTDQTVQETVSAILEVLDI